MRFSVILLGLSGSCQGMCDHSYRAYYVLKKHCPAGWLSPTLSPTHAKQTLSITIARVRYYNWTNAWLSSKPATTTPTFLTVECSKNSMTMTSFGDNPTVSAQLLKAHQRTPLVLAIRSTMELWSSAVSKTAFIVVIPDLRRVDSSAMLTTSRVVWRPPTS